MESLCQYRAIVAAWSKRIKAQSAEKGIRKKEARTRSCCCCVKKIHAAYFSRSYLNSNLWLKTHCCRKEGSECWERDKWWVLFMQCLATKCDKIWIVIQLSVQFFKKETGVKGSLRVCGKYSLGPKHKMYRWQKYRNTVSPRLRIHSLSSFTFLLPWGLQTLMPDTHSLVNIYHPLKIPFWGPILNPL